MTLYVTPWRAGCHPVEFVIALGVTPFDGQVVAIWATVISRTCGSAAVQDDIVVAGRPVRLSTSIGVAVAVAGISTDHLLTWADAAMHDAKVAGGGQICRYGVTFG